MSKYTKALAAVAAGLAVAIPSLVAASQDGTISLQEWLTVLGLFLPAVAVALSPANALTPKQLVKQVEENPGAREIVATIQSKLPGSSESVSYVDRDKGTQIG